MDIAQIARLARLELTAQESQKMAHQLGSILSFMATLDEVNTDSIEPTSHPIPGSTAQRADREGTHLSIEKVLSNAPRRDDDSFIVPKVV